ncbi:MAG: hypothetical protein AAFV29_26775, partial [Myxococcota bacterium]
MPEDDSRIDGGQRLIGAPPQGRAGQEHDVLQQAIDVRVVDVVGAAVGLRRESRKPLILVEARV